MNIPTIGRIVLYTLSFSDVRNIESYRKNYPPGTPYNLVEVGMIFPAIVVAIPQGITGSVSLQVFLDGFDTHWAPSRYEDDANGDVGQEGRWHWPVRERVNEIKQPDPAVFIDMPPAPSPEEKRRQQDQYTRMECLRIATDFLKERAGGTPAEFLAFADDIFAFAQSETPGIPTPTATTENMVPTAMKVVTEAVLNDKAYAHSWHCNIACSIMDEGVDPAVSNRAASRFMKLLFNAETSGDMMDPLAHWPVWRFKHASGITVRARQIMVIRREADGSATLSFDPGDDSFVEVPKGFMEFHHPKPKDFFLIFADDRRASMSGELFLRQYEMETKADLKDEQERAQAVSAGDEMTDLSRKLEIALRRNPKYAQSWTNVIASTLQNVGINEESAPDLAKRLMRILFKTDV